MNIRYLKYGLVLISLIIISTKNGPSTDVDGNTGIPNIIFLLADDLRHDALGYTGNPVINTPAIDALAESGAIFSNGYVTTSICSVSRASILSGQYGRRHEKWGFGPGFGKNQWLETYPGLLKEAGYRTGFIGKYGVGEINYASSQFDYWRGFPGQGSFLASDDNGNPIHLTRLIGEQASEFIEQSSPDQPFCLSVSFKAPHVEGGNDNWQLYDPAFDTFYQNAWFPQALSGEVEYFDHFNNDFMNGNEARIRYNVRFGDPQRAQESLEGYYRLVHGIDRAIARIIESLKQNGFDQETIIIFTSDNGMYLGEYGFSGKWYGSDPSIRVPFFIYDPTSSDTSKVLDNIVLNIDIAPTILDYAGVDIPASMQGESLKGFAQGTHDTNWRTDFLYEHLWPSSSIVIPSVEGVVNDSFKYMRYFMNFNFSPIIQEELYDMENDLDEVHNLASDPAYELLKQERQNRLDNLISTFD